jgi:hypothetical protein
MQARKLQSLGLLTILMILCACAKQPPRVAVSDGFVVVNDAPAYRFRNVGWDYGNITNPVLLTKNRMNHSMMGILRVRDGETLGRGTRAFNPGMSADQIRALVMENLTNRGKAENIQTGATTVAGRDAVTVNYRDLSGSQPRHGVEYAFVDDRTLFHLMFLADEGPLLEQLMNDYRQVVESFTVEK